MAKLTDFEDLVSTISNPSLKDYMREAMTCYFSGAYRGCIVMSYIALFDDLFNKIEALKSMNNDAKKIYNEIKKRRTDQVIYENYFIDQLASKNLISKLDKDMCDLIKSRRHKSAHPTGHQPSAEEARFVFFEVIDKFLSKDTLGTKHVVDDIISRLSNKFFFTSTYIKDTTSIVEEEIEVIHEQAIPYLVSMLLDTYKNNQGTIRKNSSYFLDGLSSLDIDIINEQIITKLLEKHMGDEILTKKCLSAISSNPNLMKGLKKTTLDRFNLILKEEISNISPEDVSSKLTHPSIVIKRIIDVLDISFINDNLEDSLKLIITKFPYRKDIISIVSSADTELREAYIDEIFRMAGSSTFETANEFINRLFDTEKYLYEILTGRECLILFSKIQSSSQHGAWRPSDIVEGKFKAFKKIRRKALKYIRDESTEAKIIIENHFLYSDSIKSFKSNVLGVKINKQSNT